MSKPIIRVAFQLWEPADLAKLEKGLLEAGIHLQAKKFVLKESDPKGSLVNKV